MMEARLPIPPQDTVPPVLGAALAETRVFVVEFLKLHKRLVDAGIERRKRIRPAKGDGNK